MTPSRRDQTSTHSQVPGFSQSIDHKMTCMIRFSHSQSPVSSQIPICSHCLLTERLHLLLPKTAPLLLTWCGLSCLKRSADCVVQGLPEPFGRCDVLLGKLGHLQVGLLLLQRHLLDRLRELLKLRWSSRRSHLVFAFALCRRASSVLHSFCHFLQHLPLQGGFLLRKRLRPRHTALIQIIHLFVALGLLLVVLVASLVLQADVAQRALGPVAILISSLRSSRHRV